jgi:hypothetical protein
VLETPSVSQFVDRFLEDPLPKQIGIFREAVERGAQARQRNKGRSRPQSRLAKDEIEAGDIAIHVGQAQKPIGLRVNAGAQRIEHGTAGELVALGIIAGLRQGDLLPNGGVRI